MFPWARLHHQQMGGEISPSPPCPSLSEAYLSFPRPCFGSIRRFARGHRAWGDQNTENAQRRKQSGTSILGFPSLARKSDGCARPLGCWVGRVEFTRINKAGGSAVRDLPEGCRKCAAPPAAALSRVRRYTVHKHPSSYIGQCHFPTLGGKRHNESGT